LGRKVFSLVSIFQRNYILSTFDISEAFLKEYQKGNLTVLNPAKQLLGVILKLIPLKS
jgi:hypothetical protein